MTDTLARTPLILDVDTGIDDSLALLYAAASPDAELIAVTCVSGNIDARQVGVNTRAILELAGRSDVEVALGRETPLLRPLETTARDPRSAGPRPCRAAAAEPAAVAIATPSTSSSRRRDGGRARSRWSRSGH